MVNYSESIIYKICCRNVDIKAEYVGSTTNFNRRKSEHKCSCANENNKSYNCYVYQFIRNNGNWQNFDMVEIERYNALDKHDLHKRERYWIETLNSELNGSIPTQTKKEYFQKNRETIQQYQVEYFQKNKASCQQHRAKYSRQVVKCECGSESTKGNITRHNKSQKHIEYLASILPQQINVPRIMSNIKV
jgi:hypothetical protein